MTEVKIYPEMIQGSEEWKQARCGVLTASEMHLIVTAKQLKAADNDKSRAHLYELLSQRITQHVPASYVGEDMLRGEEDEVAARDLYNDNVAEVHIIGFMTREVAPGVVLGYSPDAAVGDSGGIECKSRRPKFQVATIIDDAMPDDFRLQVQTGLLVSGWKWIDFVSYCGGLPMLVKRIYPDLELHAAIIAAAVKFHERLDEELAKYTANLAANEARLFPTQRRVETEMFV